MTSILDVDYLHRHVSGLKIDFHETLGSTNDQGIAVVKSSSLVQPLLVLAACQTQGRGQGNHRWYANHESLTFTICVPESPAKPPSPASDSPASVLLPSPIPLHFIQTIPSKNLGLLPLLTALAVTEAVDQTISDCLKCKPQSAVATAQPIATIKWPNDILIDHGKLAGILIERIQSLDRQSVFVIGIGINVNQASFPQDSNLAPATTPPPNRSGPDNTSHDRAGKNLAVPAISLQQLTGATTNLNDLLLEILRAFSKLVEILAQDATAIVTACQNRLFRLHESIQLQTPDGKIVSGICRGLSARGELLIDEDRNETSIDTSTRQQAIASGRIMLDG